MSLAVVGSGPAAFYAVLRAAQRRPGLRVDMFERQCVPFGLARFGVAPDHPEVKACEARFADAARLADFRFHGNVEVGRDVALPELARSFDAVLLAHGARGARRLGVPGEDLPGVLPARAFVGWYNGEPEFRALDVAPRLAAARRAVVVGNGNVALDVARMLLAPPDALAATDIAPHALAALRASRVRRVDIVGRRGLLHAAFANKELRELLRAPNAAMLRVEPHAQLALAAAAATLSRQDKRRLDLLARAATAEEDADAANADADTKKWQLQFLRSPAEFVGDAERGVRGVRWALNAYEDGADRAGAARVRPTGATAFTEAELAFTSIGYEPRPPPGLDALGIVPDARGVLPRRHGRCVGAADNVFAVGWAATGPVGVIASTMIDAFSVGDEIAAFLDAERPAQAAAPRPGRAAIALPATAVSWDDWLKIDAEELRRGKLLGKARLKFDSSQDILAFLGKLPPA